MKFHKYHGLGKDFIIIDPREADFSLDQTSIKELCDRNYGIGADGILFGPIMDNNNFSLRIFNPNGSEAEKSGNGLRIFARYLWELGLVKHNTFEIKTMGGLVRARVLQDGNTVWMEMGKVSFNAADIPVKGEAGEVINRTIEIHGRVFTYSAATVGNPHCVITCDSISPELAREYGPMIENYQKFPNKTNVQFMKVNDSSHIEIEIWDRGTGYILASGSSSIAAAAVAFKTNKCSDTITVKMQGGELGIQLTPDFNATMIGPVKAIYDGELREDFFESGLVRPKLS